MPGQLHSVRKPPSAVCFECQLKGQYRSPWLRLYALEEGLSKGHGGKDVPRTLGLCGFEIQDTAASLLSQETVASSQPRLMLGWVRDRSRLRLPGCSLNKGMRAGRKERQYPVVPQWQDQELGERKYMCMCKAERGRRALCLCGVWKRRQGGGRGPPAV